VTAFTGLISNFAVGWLAMRWPMGRIMWLAMLLLAASLLALPRLESAIHVYLYAAAMGVSGGAITVVFFAFWPYAYGRGHLGTITSVAQALTVLGSGLGQILPALSVKELGSYMPLFLALSPLVAVLGVCCWLVPVPCFRQTTSLADVHSADQYSGSAARSHP
jgi:predicted MFS family arabinose efflux permease